ncbi:hypothetical protein KY285_031941 [Solanum tuberosum]|nr:hypothetical protein KY285_031941 [Solanum tuberosum]
MLIPSPTSPGDAIDTYLQPLIEELKELWDVGVETYDASAKQNFKLHASLLWTINDFPAYGNLSGWSTKGKLACPCCNKDTSSTRLTNCRKQCVMGHRRYLPHNHKWRNEKESFDGTNETRPPTKVHSGTEILNQVEDLERLQLTKDPKKRKKISHENRKDNWNKKNHKISRLKSHDCHVLLQHLLPLALRDNLEQIEAQIPITLCKLEKVFPPSFFDVMVHLPIHLATEAKIAGPIHYRWMYPVERWLYFLKSLIGNRACPEGCIAGGYIAHECLSMFCQPGKTLGAKPPFELEADEVEQAHIYILKNWAEVLPYLEEFSQTHENARHLSDAEWNHQFIEWFKDMVTQLHKGDDSRIMEYLLSLSRGPTQYSTRSNGYIVNGYRFHVEVYDKKLRTQNCGVVVVGENDKDSDSLDYYGVLTDVIELQFVMDRRVTLFQCNWFDVYDEISGDKKDEFRFCWKVVRKTQPRDSFDIVELIDDDTAEIKMKSMKLENEVDSSILKSTIRYTFVAPGAIGKGQGRGQGLKSLSEKGHMTTKRLISDKSSDLVEHYIKEIETRMGRGQGLKNSTMYTSQGMETIHKKSIALEKENMQINTPTLASTHQVKQYTQKVEKTLNKSTLYANQKMQTPSKSTRMNFTTSSSQEMQTIDRLVLQKEDMQTNGTLPPSTDQVMKHSQSAEKGSNKCKEVASLENGQKLKVTFYNNRTVGTNSNLFSRHLGKIVRDRNTCPLEMNELWNKWRGYLHVKYVKDKPIQQSLKDIPKEVDKKEWEWLVKEHFASKSFQARSSRKATNRAKLKMLHHIGSKPIREIIYQQGRKDGNPPNLATIFFETRKKDNKLVEPEAIEKHAQLE